MEFRPFDPTAETWILLIPLISGKLPGRIEKRTTTGNYHIEPLINFVCKDTKLAKPFFAFESDVNKNLESKQYVTFRWNEPGNRRFIRSRNEFGEPQAVEVEVTTEEEANQLADEIREKISIALSEQLEKQQAELDKQKSRLEQTIEERISDRKNEIDEIARKLDRRQSEIQNQEARARAELDKQKAQLLAELEQARKQLFIQEQSIKLSEASLVESKEELRQLFKELEPYRLAVPCNIKEQTAQSPEILVLPENLAQQWTTLLEASGLVLSQNIANSYLLSLVSACYSGSIVLLNGPVGVGKTSIIKNSAKLLNGTSKIIPVRPAWLDPSDLLGFFDPLSETFRPSPFLTALKDAKTQGDRLCLVCLDELNLARIENYGADLLSSLEYSRSRQKEQSFSSDDGQQGLLLYSPSIETQLWEEARFLHELTDRTHEQTQRLKHIQTLLNDYPSTFTLSPNLVLLGTLNSDETTYDLSPKVIDRSYVITYPPANLTRKTAANIGSATTAILSITALHQVISSAEEFNQKSNEWQLILRWNQQYLSALGIPLGHRASREYQVFHTVATILGLSSRDCLGHFIFTKLLPRISFFKNDITSELFNRWLQELEQAYKSYDPGDVLPQLSKQMQDKRRANVRYWTKA